MVMIARIVAKTKFGKLLSASFFTRLKDPSGNQLQKLGRRVTLERYQTGQ